jgi:hypothetical protein
MKLLVHRADRVSCILVCLSNRSGEPSDSTTMQLHGHLVKCSK